MKRLILPLLTLVAVVALALPAWADTTSFTFDAGGDFYIPRPITASDQEGVRRLTGSFDVAAAGYGDLIGGICTFRVTAVNGDSVHLNNFGVLVTNGSETDVFGTESEPNVSATRLEDATLELGPVITMYNVMLDDGNGRVGTSVDYEVSATCTTTSVSTTTVPTVTSTSTTTTVETSSTTTATTTTSTSSPESSTSTTSPEPPSTIVSEPPPSTQIPPVTTGDTLPFTGPEDVAPLAMAVVALFALGGGLLRAVRAGRHEG